MKKILLLLSMFAFTSANAVEITTAFTNGDGNTQEAEQLVLNAINEAQNSVYIAAYTFTSSNISKALIKAKKRGVDVKMVMDYNQSQNSYWVLSPMVKAGIPIRVNNSYQDFHNKFMVIDNSCVETGSFNYSVAAATKNAENAILICGDENVVINYRNNFNQWFNQAIREVNA